MATLDSLKRALRQTTEESRLPFLKQPLSDEQYSAGFEIITHGAGWINYEDFIIPQASRLLSPVFDSRDDLSVVEIGPGQRSLLAYLPYHLRHKVKEYKAFEPNCLFATRLEESLGFSSAAESDLPCLASPPDICRRSFDAEDNDTSRVRSGNSSGTNDEKYDVILFCHSMYGMNPKHVVIERALRMLTGSPQYPNEGLILVFHRDNRALHFGGLLCHQTASFPHGVVSVLDDNEELDTFASFVAGLSVQGETDEANAFRAEWRVVCRAMGRREAARPGHLMFSSPELMVAFSYCSDWLPRLADVVPLAQGQRVVNNREAALHHPTPVVKPTEIKDIQEVVRFSLECGFGLTVIGGGHSSHCLWPNVVAVDMSAFRGIHIHMGGQNGDDTTSVPLVVAEAGCTTGEIIRKAMEAGLTVPLGARPSVGAGLWLQGGIGHLARVYGLACDSIVGAVIVSVENYKQVLCVGVVPSQHWPAGAIRPDNEDEILWAIKGAGTNFGIVHSMTFQAFAARTYRTRNWTVCLNGNVDAWRKISTFGGVVANNLALNASGEAHLFWEDGHLSLGVMLIESLENPNFSSTFTSFEPISSFLDDIWGPGDDYKVMDGVEVFDANMYMSGMHGGLGGGKTSSFKRCVFLKDIEGAAVASRLVAAVENRRSPLSYLHLLQGGGAVRDVADDATAFGCRDWDFACVITGVWPRDQDDTDVARHVMQWVYDVAEDLSALNDCRGAYGADLGPDPRDSALATKAFGPNGPRLARLKQVMDPRNLLRYTCPLPRILINQKIIILVTGKSCAGKDFCADVWASVLSKPNITHHKQLTVRAVSISNATKREYAEATGADLRRIQWDRDYKEQHRPALTEFFKKQGRKRPSLPQKQFLSMVRGAADIDVLLITSMRGEAPLAAFAHLVPESRLLEVYVEACDQTRRVCKDGNWDDGSKKTNTDANNNTQSSFNSLPHRPSLVFKNERTGAEAAEDFAKRRLVPFLHDDLQKLADMVETAPDFPRQGIDFRHVLGIPQKSGGLDLCVSLLRRHFVRDWAMVDSIACCESGGNIFASALAQQVGRPLLLIREAGKLPPPTISVAKQSSYVSSAASGNAQEECIELELDKVPQGGSVLVVDDVLSTGETLSAVLDCWRKLAFRPSVLTLWSWLSSRPIEAGSYCTDVGLARPLSRVFWSSAAIRREGIRPLHTNQPT